MTGTHEAASASVCVFLDILPLELRILIYEFTFRGAAVQATLAESQESSCTKPHAVLFRHSAHHNLRLSCRRIYDEALATFWSEAVLTLECPFMDNSVFSQLLDSEIMVDTYSNHLCSSLPEAAKMNVRHVRGMLFPELTGQFAEENPSLTATALLSNFKRLTTCDISPTIECDDDEEDWHIIFTTRPRNNKGFGRFEMIRGLEPKEFLAKSYGIDVTSEIVFLRKTSVRVPRSPYPEKRHAGFRNVVCYGPRQSTRWQRSSD